MSKNLQTGTVNTPDFWDHIYQNERPRWDIGHATPVFAEWLAHRNQLGTGSIAVLGCGTGHDAALFSQHGFDVTAVDFAESPLQSLQKNYPGIRTLQKDIFELNESHNEVFDFVLEYTCFCAIDPMRRDEYVQIVHTILKPGGYLIGLFFPLDERPDGPPFAVRYDDVDRHFSSTFISLLDEIPEHSVPKRREKERFVIYQKKHQS
ncbi:MAG TPA: methyltransferase domain-containing protein [bacterium]|nr:methyltransferase domain-containing protein [bacterium]HMW35563.1 methyltransferase domain-containing protein [bacterium]HMY34796.1 methyltransferase domain-containing protein [bacterium]HMZ03913.1 methyltransferase domain-containing protein [bacterium]HNB08604.1 methyltransferase domain-containing protein [bacterium]